MNATPHTHDLNVTLDSDGDIRIRYGDQKPHYVKTRYPFWRGRVRRKTIRTIRRHDRESVKAGSSVDFTSAVKKEMGLRESSGSWGSFVLSGNPLPPATCTLVRDSYNWHVYKGGSTRHVASSLTRATEYAAQQGWVISSVDYGEYGPAAPARITTGTVAIGTSNGVHSGSG